MNPEKNIHNLCQIYSEFECHKKSHNLHNPELKFLRFFMSYHSTHLYPTPILSKDFQRFRRIVAMITTCCFSFMPLKILLSFKIQLVWSIKCSQRHAHTKILTREFKIFQHPVARMSKNCNINSGGDKALENFLIRFCTPKFISWTWKLTFIYPLGTLES